MKVLTATCLSLVFFVSFAFCQITPDPATCNKIYGMNVGGWLVLEKFITPSILKAGNDSRIVDEWTFCQYVQEPKKSQILHNHWNTWVSEANISSLATGGITHLRLPIGYWSLLTQQELTANQEPYMLGAWNYAVRLLEWAKKYRLKVLVDLHGAPGSQNGWDNSGRLTAPMWGTGNTVNRTLEVLSRLAARIAALEASPKTSGVVVGLEMLNEPFAPQLAGGVTTIRDFYLRAYPLVRTHLRAEKYWFVIHNGFVPGWTKGFMSPPAYQNVWLDQHLYHCFDEGLRRAPASVHLDLACRINRRFLLDETLPSFVGEWSVAWKMDSAISHHEPYPNSTQRAFMRNLGLSQMKSYQTSPMYGWFFWNFKTESAPMWDWFLGVRNGWFPARLPDPASLNGVCLNLNTTLPRACV